MSVFIFGITMIFRRLIAVFHRGVFLAFFLSFAGNIYAQDRFYEYTDNSLLLPYVKVGSRFFDITLSSSGEAGESGGMEFILSKFSRVDTPDRGDFSFFDVANNTLIIPELIVDGEVFAARLALLDLENLRFGLTALDPVTNPDSPPSGVDEPASCNMPRDETHGPDNPTITNGWAVPTLFVQDGGPAPDGIPPLERPNFQQDPAVTLTAAEFVAPDQLVAGVKIGNDIRAYPYNIMDWHEVVNDQYQVNGVLEDFTLSYCPLTGSAMLWEGFAESANPTFGTSGLLYNSNLIMYDRETRSYWSQMLEQAVSGSEILRVPDRVQVVETTWETWSSMYPNTSVMTRNTGFSRNYDVYPYGSYREDNGLIFNVNNSTDNRLHRKDRVVGVNVGESSKVYPLSRFSSVGVETINDTVGGEPLVIAGSEADNFGVIYNRTLSDCTVLDFEPVQGQLPVVMQDNEGNEWDIFGEAVSGPRTGQTLTKTNSYISYWFAWTAFFPGAEIHEF